MKRKFAAACCSTTELFPQVPVFPGCLGLVSYSCRDLHPASAFSEAFIGLYLPLGVSCGGRGIRTPDTFRYAALAVQCIQPLCHSSESASLTDGRFISE